MMVPGRPPQPPPGLTVEYHLAALATHRAATYRRAQEQALAAGHAGAAAIAGALYLSHKAEAMRLHQRIEGQT